MASLFKYPGEQEREFRVRSGSKYPHVPDLAYKWLEALYEQGGLPDLSPQEIRIKGRVAVRPVLGDPTNTPADASTHAARLDNGQVVWVKLDERHLSGGHEATYVVEKPASIRAILAALTVLESKETNMETLRRVVPFAEPSHPRSVEASLFEVLRQLPEDEEGADRVWVLLRDLHGSLDYRTVD